MIKNNIKKFMALIFFVVFVSLKLLIGPVTCNSGWKSPSIGTSGACSHHGGVAGWKNSVPFLLSGVVALWFFVTLGKERNSNKVNPIAKTKENEIPKIVSGIKTEEIKPSSTLCPKCNGQMILRIAKKGKNVGQEFWGCSGYPRCDGTRKHTSETGFD